MKIVETPPVKPAFKPVTLVLETKEELYLILGFLRLSRGSNGAIKPESLFGEVHQSLMKHSRGAYDAGMFVSLADYAKKERGLRW